MGDQRLYKPEEIAVSVEQAPVEPAYLVVLAVRVVVAALRSANFVAHLEHRHANRNQQNDKEIFDLASAQPLNIGIVARAFEAAVPREVVVRPVPVPFAIGLIVLFVIRNQIVQREAVVAGHKVYALFGLAFLVSVDIGAAEHALRQCAHPAGVAFYKATDVVAEPAIPLLPAVADKASDLIETGGIPRLCDQFGAGENGVGLNVPKNRRIFEWATRFVPGQ